MENKELICLACDYSCTLLLTLENSKLICIEGNKCNKGVLYASKKCIIPSSIVKTIIKVNNGSSKTLTVKSELGVPKSLIFSILNELKDLTVNAPINSGDIIKENICNTGINIIAEGNVKLYS